MVKFPVIKENLRESFDENEDDTSGNNAFISFLFIQLC